MNKLIITSSNKDFCGTWTKNEVLQEMEDVLGKFDPNAWIEWVLDHNFVDYPPEILKFLNAPGLMTAEFSIVINGHIVKISYS